MAKIKIYLKMVKGELQYRDTEGHHGKTITTHVKPGSTIIWKLDKNPGITEITNITIKGDESILKEKPKMIDFDHWEAIIANNGFGEASYYPEVLTLQNMEKLSESTYSAEILRDGKPPIIKLT